MQLFHHRRRIVAGSVASLLAASLVASPPAAVAETVSFSDPAHDIQAGADVLSVEVTNERRVTVVVRHRDLRRSATPAVSVMVDMYPNRPGPELSVDLNIYELYVWRVRRWQVSGEVPVACPVTGGFDYRADLTRVVMSRRGDCLRSRGPVRVSVAAFGRSGTDWAPGHHRFFPWVRRF